MPEPLPADDPSPEDDSELAQALIDLERRLSQEQGTQDPQSQGQVADILKWALAGPAETRGLCFGPYELREFRGAGTYGAVWRATDRRSGSTVAIKIPHLNWRPEGQIAERYRTEAVALQRFSHTNVLQVLAVAEESKRVALVMEYCEGPSLERWLNDQDRLPDPKVAAWIVQVLAEGVDACHQNGIVHGDIKPANVMLFKPGGCPGFPYEPRLTDFGLAVLASDPSRGSSSSLLGGTLEYMAPELFRAGVCTRSVASDVYALGVMLHVLLTGRTPFGSGSIAEVVARVLEDRPRPFTRPDGTVPQSLERIVRVCLAKSPRSRYASAAELARNLRAFLEEREVEARIESLAMQWARQLRRKERVLEAGLLIIVIESVLIVWMWVATGMALIGVRWLPPHMTEAGMLRDSTIMSAINLLPLVMAIGFMRGNRWCALVAAAVCGGSTLLSIGNLTGLVPPPLTGCTLPIGSFRWLCFPC